MLLLLAAMIWANRVSGVLYLCTDSIGIFDFIPPFVHGVGGDVYYVPAWRVWFLWFAMVIVACLGPAAVLAILCARCNDEDDLDG